MSLSLADRAPLLAARFRAVNTKFMHLSDPFKFAFIALFDLATVVMIGVLVVTLPLVAVSIVTTVMSILVKVLGMPAQIRKLWLQKSAYELSFTNAVTNQLSYGCWVAFAIKSHNLTVFVAQGAGIIGSTAITTIVLSFLLRPPMTSFGHPRGRHCKFCLEALEGLVVYFKWPYPCFGCPTGHFHVVDFAPSALTAKCDICGRKAFVEVTGPMADPEWWQGWLYQIRVNRPGADWETVTLERYLEAEKLALRGQVRIPAGIHTLRVGVPTHFEFYGDEGEFDGRVLSPDGEKSLILHLAEEKGRMVRFEIAS